MKTEENDIHANMCEGFGNKRIKDLFFFSQNFQISKFICKQIPMHGLRLTARITPITVAGESHTNPSHTTGPWGFRFSPKHPLKIGNWVLRVLEMRSLWKANREDHRIQEVNEQVYDHQNAHHNRVLIDQECDACMIDDDDEDEKVEFDRNSFSKLLWSVTLSEARLYAQMAYLGSLSYTIPQIKFGNLLRRHKLRFITSSIEKKAKKAKVSEEVQHDSETVVVADDLNSLCSSPCEWYICDDDESSTRFFVIQGSESLASWQANLLFEPIQFEAMDTIVHRGIYEAAKVVYEEMLPYVHDHLQRHGNRATIRLTGHSLGGSLSLLVNLMLLIRGEVHRSSLLPVVTFGAPWVMCGGDRLLYKLGLPRNHLQGITMHRDIVPRAFSCNYPTRVAHLLKAVNGNFRNHPCLNNQNLLYAPMGEFLILQPDAKLSPSHQLLPSGSGLYVLRSQVSDANIAKKQTRAARSIFLNTPHPLEILTDRCAYGSEGAILRDHDVDTYLISIRNVISQELKRVRRMRRQQQRQFWWRMLGVNHRQVKVLVDSGREWWLTMVSTHLIPLVVVVLVPFARLLIMKACSWIRSR